MMNAYGSDRIARGEDGSWLISSRHSKGWVARRPAKLGRAEFPGTCVRWNDTLFEVVGIELLSQGLRYRLRPWEDCHAIRICENYDGASEERRRSERLDTAKRNSRRRGVMLIAPLAGFLPGRIQQRLENEWGVPVVMLTILSLVVPFAFGTASLIFMMALGIGGAEPPFPAPLVALGLFLFFESLVRFLVATSQKRPMGAFILELVDAIVQHRDEKRQRDAMPEWRNETDRISTEHADSYRLREPYLGLLSATEQMMLAERYGFEPIRGATRTAIVLLIAGSIGLVSTIMTINESGPSFSRLLSLLLAIALVGEQIVRLLRLRQGRIAGSFVAPIVRPFLIGLLERKPPGRLDAGP